MDDSRQPSAPLRVARSSSIQYYLNKSQRHGKDPGKSSVLVMFVHGWGCTATEYLPLLEALTERQPQHSYAALATPEGTVTARQGASSQEGTSSPPTTEMTEIASHINDLISELLEPLANETRVVVVGHSMGSRIALETARQQPNRIAGIIILDGSNSTQKPFEDIMARHAVEQAADKAAGIGSALYAAAEQSSEPLLKKMQAGFGSMSGPHTPLWLQKLLATHLTTLDMPSAWAVVASVRVFDKHTFATQAAALAAGTFGKTSGGTGARVLALSCTEGPGTQRVRLRPGEINCAQAFWRDAFASSGRGKDGLDVVTMAGCGHWLHVDETEHVADEITRFLGTL